MDLDRKLRVCCSIGPSLSVDGVASHAVGNNELIKKNIKSRVSRQRLPPNHRSLIGGQILLLLAAIDGHVSQELNLTVIDER